MLPPVIECNGVKRQFTFKALNAVTKEQMKEAHVKSRSDVAMASSSNASQSNTRRALQQAFFQQVHKPLPKSPPKEAVKRKDLGQTGETPEPKNQRDM